MANILDYLDWRGDLSLRAAPFNEVDNLIIAELSFIDFSGIVPAYPRRNIPTLRYAAERYFTYHAHRAEEMGVLVPGGNIVELMRKMAASVRFAEMRLLSYVNLVDEEREMQFAALTVELSPRLIYVAFRGTDDTLVGWKEDFNMGFMTPVPAQEEARTYLDTLLRRYPLAYFMVGGHSKGGNLAVYASAYAEESLQRRIIAVYNNDGPGFGETLLETEEHRRIEDCIRTIVPESDVVGMLLNHEEHYSVVKSDQKVLLQHDGFSWQVKGAAFEHLSDISREGHLVDKTLRGFAAGLTREQREKFADVLYDILTASDARTLNDLQKGKWRSVSAMLRAHRELDEESRELLNYTLRLLFREGARSIKDALLQPEHSFFEETIPKIEEKLEEALPGLRHALGEEEDE